MQTGKTEGLSEEARTRRIVDTKNGTSLWKVFGSHSTDDGGEKFCCVWPNISVNCLRYANNFTIANWSIDAISDC